jgi:hypothetical protein
MFTDANVPPWGPLPEVDDPKAGHQAITVNVGGCYALELNDVACGKAMQNLNDCRFTACFAIPCPPNPTKTQLQNCYAAADKGACKAIAAAVPTACAAVTQQQLDDAKAECEPQADDYSFEGPVRIQCINGPTGEAG